MFQRYRLLVVLGVIALVVGAREQLVSRRRGELGWLTPEGLQATEVLGRLNPDDPDTDYLRAMQALAAGDRGEFDRRMERALASGPKHNELLLKFHADVLLATGADAAAVNRALDRWRRNYPFSDLPITLELSAGPLIREEAARLEEALTRIPWVAEARLEPYQENGVERWEVRLRLQRARVIDIRQAYDALERGAF